MTPELLRRTIAEYLSHSHSATVLVDGEVLFDLAEAKYSVSGEYNKCLLQFWSSERNLVRRVLDAEEKGDRLRLLVQRMGQNHPSKLEICRERDRRSPSTRKAARARYENQLRRMLQRRFPDWNVVRFTSSMDLEHSFGPAYARGMMWRGQTALAVLGVNEEETQSTIDGALTFGMLWLEACRRRQSGHAVVSGLLLALPKKTSAITRQRIGDLDHGAARWMLFECSEREGTIDEVDCADRGNMDTRLTQCPNEAAVRERFEASIEKVREILPRAEVAVVSNAEISFRLRGLEFARVRLAHDPRTFESGQEIVFGVGAEERVLDETNREEFGDLINLAAAIRNADGPRTHPLWRMCPERWLESIVISDIQRLDNRLRSGELYSQVPAFSAADRAMIDVLALTRNNRLAVVELKADEDIHLPLQAVDYWSRVSWHHSRGEFSKFGYFPGTNLSNERPLLLLVAAALRIHPATDTILKYLSPEVEWELLGIDEHWREGVHTVFRKRQENVRPLPTGEPSLVAS